MPIENQDPREQTLATGQESNRFWVFSLFMAAVTLMAYYPALNGGFVWDDDAWTTSLTPLTHGLAGLKEIWLTPTSLQQYYPLTGTSFWLDHEYWGWWTLPYHVENVLLHVLSAILLWRLLQRLAIPGARLAALIFALHPMMVESVAWITERKNVLSMPFFLGALLAYASYTHYWKEAAMPERRSRRAYWLALVLFLAALFAKATAFVFPPALLLLCWWKHGSLRWKEDVLPTLPLFVLALALSAEVNWLEKHHVGAVGADFAHSFTQRLLIAGRAFWFYPSKLLWPANLCFIYPQWKVDSSDPEQWLWPVAMAAALILPWCWRERIGRGPVIAIWFYAGAIFPSLGFMDVYALRFLDVWDHWSYLPSLSLLILGVSLLVRWTARFSRLKQGICSIALLSLLGFLTSQQAAQFQSMEKLWLTTLEKNPDCWLAHHNLGLDLEINGRLEEAVLHYEKALAIRPDHAEFHNDLGTAFTQQGQIDKALPHYRKALELEPENAQFHSNLASLLVQMGQLTEASDHFKKAVALRPSFVEFHKDLASTLLKMGHTDEALAEYRAAVVAKPDDAEAQVSLGNLYIKLKQAGLAAEHYRKAIEIRPDDAEAHNNLGWALQKSGQMREAIAQYYSAVRADPKFLLAHKNLAWIQATAPDAALRDSASALLHAQDAAELDGSHDATVLITLAAAQAENGSFVGAIATAKKALILAHSQNNSTLSKAIDAQIKIYEAGFPMRDPSLGVSSAQAPSYPLK